jgi:Domain of unknown function (DUF1338)
MLEIQKIVIDKIIKQLWINYKNKVGQVKIIEDAIRQNGDHWSEDHIAFRTLPGDHCSLHILQGVFEILGYKKCDDYNFEEKKLKAVSLNPPMESSLHSTQVFPKVFISILELSSFSSPFQQCILKYTSDVVSSPLEKFKSEWIALEQNPHKIDEFAQSITLFLSNGASWRTPTSKDYELLRKESEYAAWTLVYGNTPNHFTVSIHLMKNFSSLKEFNDFVQSKLGIQMNNAGGNIIKGSLAVRLEQSATLAEDSIVPFQDGYKKIPYAFVEFAYRHPLEGNKNDGKWDSYYQGFVTDNADKIFESTNIRN